MRFLRELQLGSTFRACSCRTSFWHGPRSKLRAPTAVRNGKKRKDPRLRLLLRQLITKRSEHIMTGEQIAFLLVALFTLGSGLMVVTTRNLVHAALWLVSTLFGVAVTYALLNASFLAVVQVVVYIGAIAILFIFAVMLTRKDLRDQGAQQNSNWWVGALLSMLTFGGLLLVLQGWNSLSKTAAQIPAGFDAV